MPSAESHVRRWREAGLLDEAQARRILAYEEAHAAREAAPRIERPSLLEAILYLGVAVVAVGVVSLVAQSWDDLTSGTRVATLAVPGVLALLAGAAMRASRDAAVARASAMAWLASVPLLAGAVAVTGVEAEWQDRYVLMMSAATATVLSLGLWVVHPGHLQVIAMAGSLVFLSEAVAAWPEEYTATVAGLLIMVFGGAGLALTELRHLTPTFTARLLASAGLVLGPFHAGMEDAAAVWPDLLVLAASVVVIGLSLRRGAFTYMVVGVAGTFIGLVALILKHFEDEIGAPVALILSGALLVAGALLLARLWRRLPAEPTP